jgi:hypothetical protein
MATDFEIAHGHLLLAWLRYELNFVSVLLWLQCHDKILLKVLFMVTEHRKRGAATSTT